MLESIRPGNPITTHHVTVTGKLAAPQTLVFVHGFGTDQRAWDAVAKPFLPDYRLVLLDNAGAGQFDPTAFEPARYINLYGFRDDLLDVCAALHLRGAILIGHSVGAMIGVLASLKQPLLFSRLVLISASPRYMDDEDYYGGFTKADIDDVFSAMAEKYQEWISGFAPLMMGNPHRSELAEYFAAKLKMIPPKTALTIAHAIFNSDHRVDVRKINLPTLLIQARDDNAVPLEVAEYLHREILGSILDVIAATGHLPHISAPDAVIASIKRFIETN